MTLGEKIQLSRKKKGMSQEDLANVLNISRQAVQKWESDISKPELNKLVELSNIFDVSIDFLLKGENFTDNEVKPASSIPEREQREKTIINEKHLNSSRLKTIKIWMIIGAVLSPLSFGGLMLNNGQNPWGLWVGLALYVVTIPICVYALKRCREAKSQSDLIGFGVASILFCSFIGGILMLSSKDKYFVADKPLTQEEIERERNRQLAEAEKTRKCEEERKRLEVIENEKKRISTLRAQQIVKIVSLYESFKIKKYNPADIKEAETAKNTAIYKINCQNTDKELLKVVSDYQYILEKFKLDEEYYIKKKKKIKKFFAIFTPVLTFTLVLAILTGTVFVPLGKYNYAMTLIANGDYSEANKWLNDANWQDSKKQIELNKAREHFNSGLYELGIDVLYKLGVDVDVSYELNGGQGKTLDTIRKYSYISNEPTKNGYTFGGWYVDSYSIGSSKVNYKTNLHLSAIWNLNKYSITYELNGGRVSNPNPTTYTIESNTFKLNNPTKTGYRFNGWTGTRIGDTPTTSVTIFKGSYGERIYYANWSSNSYLINFDPNGGDCIVDTMSVFYNSSFELPFPTKIGYEFIGWFDTNNKKWDSGVWTYDFDLNLKAKWEIKNFELNYELNGGFCDNLPTSYTYFDDDIVIPNPVRTGCEFEGWSGTDLAKPTKNLVISKNSLGNRSFIAEWLGLTYHISFDTDGGVIDADSMTVVYGNGFKLPIPTKTGYTFIGWKYNNLIIESGIWEIANDVILKAEWKVAEYTLSFNLNGGNIANIPPTSYTYFTEDIHIDNPTKTGYTFSGWEDLETGVVTISDLVISKNSLGDKYYSALWNGIILDVSFDPNGGECEISSASYVYGSTVTLPKPTLSGYDFNGWWIDGVTIIYDGVWEIDHDVALKARWNKTPQKSSYPSFSWGYYPQSVEEDAAILEGLATATDLDGDGYLEYSGNKYAVSRCAYSNNGRKSDSGKTIFTYGETYYFKVSSIAWLGEPYGSATDSTRVVHTRRVLEFHSFGSDNNYYTSSIRTYLISDFYNKIFTSYEKKKAGTPYLGSTPIDYYDTAGQSGYPTDWAVCRGIKLASSSSKVTLYWVTKKDGDNVGTAVSGEYSSGYLVPPYTNNIGVRPLINFSF